MTHDELLAHFSSPIYDVEAPYIQKILDGCPDVTDERIGENASAFMQEAEDEAVELSPKDAVHLAEVFKPTPMEKIMEDLKAAGINTMSDLQRILDRAEKEETPDFEGERAASAVEKAEALERYAAALTANPDIILLGRPVFWPELDTAWLKLAVLCEELTQTEQDILTAMYDSADGGAIHYKGNIPLVVFDIEGIHEK